MPEKVIAAAASNGLQDHLWEIIVLVVAILGPFMTLIAYFVKRTIGRVEKDIDCACDAIEDLDNRITDAEKLLVQVQAFHPLNHPGQEIKNK